jgi:F0F1-type ATP synthase assembly protein I
MPATTTGAAQVVGDAHDDEQNEPTINAWTLVGLGGFLVGCVVAGLVVGALIDDAEGSSPVGVLIGLSVGVVVAIVGSCVRIARYLRR